MFHKTHWIKRKLPSGELKVIGEVYTAKAYPTDMFFVLEIVGKLDKDINLDDLSKDWNLVLE